MAANDQNTKAHNTIVENFTEEVDKDGDIKTKSNFAKAKKKYDNRMKLENQEIDEAVEIYLPNASKIGAKKRLGQ